MNKMLKRNLYLAHSSKTSLKFQTRKEVDVPNRVDNTPTKKSLSDFSTTSSSNYSQKSANDYKNEAYAEAGKARGNAMNNAGKLTTDHSFSGSTSSGWDNNSGTVRLEPSRNYGTALTTKPQTKKVTNTTNTHDFSGSSSDFNKSTSTKQDNTMHAPTLKVGPSGGNYKPAYEDKVSGLNLTRSYGNKTTLSTAKKPNSSKEAENSGSSYTPPKTWGEQGSEEFKNNKKEYNSWYYERNKDRWKEQYNNPAFTRQGQVDALNEKRAQDAAKNATANMYRDRAYEEAGKARGNAMNNLGKTSVSEVSSSASSNTGNQIMASMNSSGTTSKSLSSILSSAFDSIRSLGQSLLRLFF